MFQHVKLYSFILPFTEWLHILRAIILLFCSNDHNLRSSIMKNVPVTKMGNNWLYSFHEELLIPSCVCVCVFLLDNVYEFVWVCLDQNVLQICICPMAAQREIFCSPVDYFNGNPSLWRSRQLIWREWLAVNLSHLQQCRCSANTTPFTVCRTKALQRNCE